MLPIQKQEILVITQTPCHGVVSISQSKARLMSGNHSMKVCREKTKGILFVFEIKNTLAVEKRPFKFYKRCL